MKIICESCGASESPAAIWRDGARIALECGSCHFIAEVIVPRSEEARAALEAPTEPLSPAAPVVLAEPSETPAEAASSTPASKATATHSQGHPSGDVQCQKCGNRQDKVEACVACGFVFANYVEGEMPWELIPDWQEEELTKAEELWTAAVGSRDEEAHQAFIAYCVANELESFAGRKLRFRLADEPDDALVARHLGEMLERGQASLLAKMQASKSQMQERASAFKKNMLWIVFLVGMALAMGFIWLYPNLFSR